MSSLIQTLLHPNKHKCISFFIPNLDESDSGKVVGYFNDVSMPFIANVDIILAFERLTLG